MNFETFKSEIETSFAKHIPTGWIRVNTKKMLGEHVEIVLGIQSPDKHAHRIERNDPSWQAFIVEGVVDGEITDKLIAQSCGVTSILTKPEPNTNYVYKSVKCGWRKKTGTPEQLVKHYDNYFKKIAKLITEVELVHEL